MTKNIGHQPEAGFLADRTVRLRLGADIASRPNQLRVGITHLVTTEPAEANLVHEHPPGKAMVDDASPIG